MLDSNVIVLRLLVGLCPQEVDGLLKQKNKRVNLSGVRYQAEGGRVFLRKPLGHRDARNMAEDERTLWHAGRSKVGMSKSLAASHLPGVRPSRSDS